MNLTPILHSYARLPKSIGLRWAGVAAKVLVLVGLGACSHASPAPVSAVAVASPAPGGGQCASESPTASYSDGLQNVARLGTASQSSTGHWSWDATPDLAIDGNKDGDYWKHSVAHTQADADGAWWQVDMGKEYPLSKVVIWNRTDGGWGARLTNFRLWVSKADGSTSFETVLCPDGRAFSPAMTIKLPPGVQGQVVHVRLNGTNYLQLAEVEVFAPR
ncbi:MAG TPA: discoidin domain-containing protein [Polyangiaceae bacterium]|nr:discoidin domain-containing protein [Polyangiaceae bacterium]